MIDGRYTEREWQTIIATTPGLPSADLRSALESATNEYLRDSLTRKRMEGSAKKRDQWQQVAERSNDLLATIDAIDVWTAPIWDQDAEFDVNGERAEIKANLERLINHARENALTYEAHSKQHSGKQHPPREKLYSQILRVWTENIGRDPSYSSTGPIVRFFNAVLEPVLGEEKPKPATISGIIDRDEQRRLQTTTVS